MKYVLKFMWNYVWDYKKIFQLQGDRSHSSADENASSADESDVSLRTHSIIQFDEKSQICSSQHYDF